MLGLDKSDSANIIHASILTSAFLIVFLVVFFSSRRRNIPLDTVVSVDPREPHSVTITFVPVCPPEGLRAPPATPATGLGGPGLPRMEMLTRDEYIRQPPPAA